MASKFRERRRTNMALKMTGVTASDSQANRSTIRCLSFTIVPFAVIWLLAMVNIFPVEKALMTVTFLVTSAVLLTPWVICRAVGTEKPWIKYMILFSLAVALTIISTVLTYHAVLLFALPLFYASQYSGRRVVVYTYLLTVLSLFFSVVGGYYFAASDINALLLSTGGTADFFDLLTGTVQPVLPDLAPWASLLLIFLVPRSIILLAFIPVIRQISGSIAKNAVYTAELVRLSETDKLTQFYNKRKFDEMSANHYPTLDRVAVLFIDVNNLKQINDTYGHAQGDNAIAGIAACITELAADDRKAYRVGGDEFIMVLENPAKGETEALISAFYDALAARQPMSSIPISASVGWAIGPGRDIHALTGQADADMYRNKRLAHAKNVSASVRVPAPSAAAVAAQASSELVLDRSGLDDRTFLAISNVSERMYIYLCNMSTNVSRWSRNAVEYFDLPGEYMLDAGIIWEDHIHPEDRAMYRSDIKNVFSGKQQRHDLEYRARNRYGDYVVCTCSGTVQHGAEGEPDFFVGTIVNHGIIDTVDPVTNLYNIYEFTSAIQSLRESRRPTMVLMIGINHFHFVNDIYDYVFGNKVLHTLGQTMINLVRRTGTVYRMDGAKFALCLRDFGQKETQALYDRLSRLASEELVVEGTRVSLTISGGAVYVGSNYSGGEYSISSSASYALELSKRERHSELVFFNNELGDDTRRSIELVNALRQDISNDCHGFSLVYQTLVEARNGRICGMEALLRWSSKEFGEVSPGRFIPVLEKDPAFFALGNWILRKALTDAKPIVEQDPHFFLNVNVSYAQIERSGFRDSVMEILQQTGYPPANLCLELTERCRSLDMEYLRAELQFFRSRGIRISLDDFGTGVSSLNLICDLPVDGLKIDQGFILHILENQNAQMVVEATIGLTRKLGIDVCLEGVENRQIRDFVLRYPADHHQGFHYARPQPIEMFRQHLESQQGGHLPQS